MPLGSMRGPVPEVCLPARQARGAGEQRADAGRGKRPCLRATQGSSFDRPGALERALAGAATGKKVSMQESSPPCPVPMVGAPSA